MLVTKETPPTFFFFSSSQSKCSKHMPKIRKEGDDVLWKTFAASPFQGAALPVLQAGLNECSVPLLIPPDLCCRELIVQTSGRLQSAFLAAGSCAVLHNSGPR